MLCWLFEGGDHSFSTGKLLEGSSFIRVRSFMLLGTSNIMLSKIVFISRWINLFSNGSYVFKAGRSWYFFFRKAFDNSTEALHSHLPFESCLQAVQIVAISTVLQYMYDEESNSFKDFDSFSDAAKAQLKRFVFVCFSYCKPTSTLK